MFIPNKFIFDAYPAFSGVGLKGNHEEASHSGDRPYFYTYPLACCFVSFSGSLELTLLGSILLASARRKNGVDASWPCADGSYQIPMGGGGGGGGLEHFKPKLSHDPKRIMFDFTWRLIFPGKPSSCSMFLIVTDGNLLGCLALRGYMESLGTI